jgi:hypothetical protein
MKKVLMCCCLSILLVNNISAQVPQMGRYYMRLANGRALEAESNTYQNNGCKVQIWNQYFGLNQLWDVADAGGVIDRGGTAVQLWDCLNGVNQVWTLELAVDRSVVADNLVDLRGNSTPYRNQAEPAERGGSTYFGSLSALEAAYKKRGYGDLDLAEEFMAIGSKMFGLHPYWSDISTANYRENQFAGTQGGGSIAVLAQGLRIPKENIIPYGQFTISADWDTRDQKVTNNFNFSVWKRFPQIANATYYGVSAFEKIPTINAENLERVLSLGYEVRRRRIKAYNHSAIKIIKLY